MSEKAEIDHFTAAGAARLAEHVKKYWEGLGHNVAVRLVELPSAPSDRSWRRGRTWTITTNLSGGLPVDVARPGETPTGVVRRELACGKSPVQIERVLMRAYPDLSRQELRAAFLDAGTVDGH